MAKMKLASKDIIKSQDNRTLLLASKFLVRLTSRSKKWQWAIKKVIEMNRKEKGQIGMGDISICESLFDKSVKNNDEMLLASPDHKHDHHDHKHVDHEHHPVNQVPGVKKDLTKFMSEKLTKQYKETETLLEEDIEKSKKALMSKQVKKPTKDESD